MTIDFENPILEGVELFLKVEIVETRQFKNVRFQPYIYGRDVLGFQFLWGFVPELNIFYKIPTYLICEVSSMSIRFTPISSAKYIRPDGERHYCVVKGEWRYKSLISE